MDLSFSHASTASAAGSCANPLPAPHLLREVECGSVEYKLHLSGVSPLRTSHLATQLRWRLREGGGKATYYIGVCDDGRAVGISPADADSSISTLEGMASIAGASLDRVLWMEALPCAHSGDAATGATRPVAAADARILRVELRRKPSGASASGEAVHAAERGGSSSAALIEPRVALVGAQGAGKSTLVASLALGVCDDGRGGARAVVVRHRHELEEGTTSAAGCWFTVGFDEHGKLVPTDDAMSVASAGSDGHDLLSFRGPSEPRVRSVAKHTLALLDLPGAEKYRKSALSGLLGSAPDATLLIVNGADASLGGSATADYVRLLAALHIPCAIVVTHDDALAAPRAETRSRLAALVASAGVTLAPDSDAACMRAAADADGGLSVFFVSCLRGASALVEIARSLAALVGRRRGVGDEALPPGAKGVLRVLDTWSLGGRLIVGGLCTAGSVCEGDRVAFGGLREGDSAGGDIMEVYVAGERAADGSLYAGSLGSVSLGRSFGGDRRALRRGALVACVAAGSEEASLAAALAPARIVSFNADARWNDFSRGPWRPGVAAVLIGTSGLRVGVTISAIASVAQVGAQAGAEMVHASSAERDATGVPRSTSRSRERAASLSDFSKAARVTITLEISPRPDFLESGPAVLWDGAGASGGDWLAGVAIASG